MRQLPPPVTKVAISNAFNLRCFVRAFVLFLLLTAASMQNTWSQINYNKFTCISEPLKYSSSIGDSVRTLGFANFGAGYRVLVVGDTCFGIGNNINIDLNANNAFAIGNGITLNLLARDAYAFGNNIGIGANMAFAIGNLIKSNFSNTITIGIGESTINPFQNTIEGSFMLSMHSTAPSIFVGTGNDVTIGKVGIGIITPGSQLQINGNCAIGYNNNTIAPDNGLLVNGNVGIGTSTLPIEKLEVNGNIRLQTMVPGNSENGTILWNGTDLLYRKNNNWQSFSYNSPWDTTNTTVVTNKNVGIGTSTLPIEKLEVNGNIRLQTMVPGNSENGTILWNGTDLLYRKNNKWKTIAYNSPWDTTNTTVVTNKKVGIGVENPTETLEINGSLKLHAKEALIANDGTIIWNGVDFLGRKNGSWFSLTATGITTSEWITTENGIYTNSKRVGINTEPDAIFHIKSFINPRTNMVVPASIRLETAVNANQEPIVTDLINSNGNFIIKHQDKEVFTINNSSVLLSDKLIINRPNTTDPDIIITKEGEQNNPGIRFINSYNTGGGTVPDAIVTSSYNLALCEGALKIQTNTPTTAVDIISFTPGGINIPSQTNTYMGGNVGIGALPTNQIRFKVGGNASFTGNIGIGTNILPTSPLHIKGSNTDITLENTNNTPPNESSKVIIRAANGSGRIISDKDFAIFIDADNNQTNESFNIMSNSDYWSSNVVNLLQVKSEGTTINNRITVGSNANTVIMGYDGAHNYIESNNSDLLINYYNQKNVSISKDLSVGGNVNIGNNVKLYNDGKVWAKDFVVATQCPQGWPDYVFDNKHQLIPLEELDKFIKDNKHLPEVPTSESISTTGQNLGEMNVILLKKVEELTLYIIEQNKQIELLKKQDEETQKSLQEIKINNNSK